MNLLTNFHLVSNTHTKINLIQLSLTGEQKQILQVWSTQMCHLLLKLPLSSPGVQIVIYLEKETSLKMECVTVERRRCFWVTAANENSRDASYLVFMARCHPVTLPNPNRVIIIIRPKTEYLTQSTSRIQMKDLVTITKTLRAFQRKKRFSLMLKGRRPWYIGAYCLRGAGWGGCRSVSGGGSWHGLIKTWEEPDASALKNSEH